jgi:DNA-binding CsgD family transcriptional regulator
MSAGPSTLHGVTERSWTPVSSLTQIERRVLGLMVDGVDGRKIASELKISRSEVSTHVESMLSKRDVHPRLEAATNAVRYRVMKEALRHLGEPNHPHLIPMDEAQLLAHVRRMHARGIPQFRSVSAEELRRQHDLVHGTTPPSPA